MPTQNIMIPLLVIAIIVYAIIRQVTPQRVRRIRFIIFPLIALYEAVQSLPSSTIAMTDVFECGLTVIIAVLCGLVQAWSSKVFYQGDDLYTKGGSITLVTWAFFLLSRIGIDIAFNGPHFYTSMAHVAWINWAAIAVLFGTRSIFLYLRHPEIGHAMTRNNRHRATR